MFSEPSNSLIVLCNNMYSLIVLWSNPAFVDRLAESSISVISKSTLRDWLMSSELAAAEFDGKPGLVGDHTDRNRRRREPTVSRRNKNNHFVERIVLVEKTGGAWRLKRDAGRVCAVRFSKCSLAFGGCKQDHLDSATKECEFVRGRVPSPAPPGKQTALEIEGFYCRVVAERLGLFV